MSQSSISLSAQASCVVSCWFCTSASSRQLASSHWCAMTRWRHDHHDRRHVVYWGKGLKPTPPNSLMWPQKGSESPKGVWHEKPLCTWNQSLAFFCDVRNGHLDWESLIQRVVGLHLNISIHIYIILNISQKSSKYISKHLNISKSLLCNDKLSKNT